MNIGKFGEETACAYLEEKGYLILARNYHSRYGEIDIIAQDCDYLVFAEIKTRSPNAMDTPQASVTYAKQQKIIKTAQYWLLSHPMDRQPRFDVLALTVQENPVKILHIAHFKNAFYAENAW